MSKKLKFKYCECGCKGYEGGTGGNSFWIYWDLKNKYTLNRGHGWSGSLVDVYKSYEEATEEAARLFKIEFAKSSNCLK